MWTAAGSCGFGKPGYQYEIPGVFHLGSATTGAVRAANPLRLTALPSSGAVTLAWDATPGAASYAVERAPAADGPYLQVAQAVARTDWRDAGAPAGGAFYRVRALDPRSRASGFSPVASAAPAASTLANGWVDLDVGVVSAAGTSAPTAGGFMMTASGADIWGAADGFHFTFRPVWGDGAIVARVASQQDTHEWAKAGVMIRESLAPAAQRVFMGVTPRHGAHFSWRIGSWTSGAAVDGWAAPAWVRLERRGATFTGSVSADGAAWTQVGTIEVAMPELVEVGLAMAALTGGGTLGSVSFEGVRLPAAP